VSGVVTVGDFLVGVVCCSAGCVLCWPCFGVIVGGGFGLVRCFCRVVCRVWLGFLLLQLGVVKSWTGVCCAMSLELRVGACVLQLGVLVGYPGVLAGLVVFGVCSPVFVDGVRILLVLMVMSVDVGEVVVCLLCCSRLLVVSALVLVSLQLCGCRGGGLLCLCVVIVWSLCGLVLVGECCAMSLVLRVGVCVLQLGVLAGYPGVLTGLVVFVVCSPVIVDGVRILLVLMVMSVDVGEVVVWLLCCSELLVVCALRLVLVQLCGCSCGVLLCLCVVIV